jgi:hypothetical protein
MIENKRILMILLVAAVMNLCCYVLIVLPVLNDAGYLDKQTTLNIKRPVALKLTQKLVEGNIRLSSPPYFTGEEISNAIESREKWSSSLYLKNGKGAADDGHRRFDFLGPVVPQCKQIETFGVEDDEKRACKLKDLLRASPPTASCTIISLGSHNQWGFEEAVFHDLPRCQIHTFDCTIPVDSKPPVHISARTTLHPICIGDRDYEKDGAIFKSWKSIMNLIHETRAPLYLKMDIEGYEYSVLQSIIDGNFLIPMQIAVELHYFRSRLLPNGKSSMELALFMEYLYRKGGYFLIDRHDNHLCSSCSEILLSQASFPSESQVQMPVPEAPIVSPFPLSGEQMKTGRILVILFGQPRGGPIAWKSLKTQVLDVLNADLATLFTKTAPPFLDSITKYTWIIPELGDWGDRIDALGCHSNWTNFCNINGNVFGSIARCGVKTQRGGGGILLVLRAVLYEMLTSQGIADLYDHFILTRSDHVYGCPHPTPQDMTSTYIPEGEDYDGVCDRHQMSPRGDFLRSINTKSILCDPDVWIPRIQATERKNTEGLLKTFFDHQKIRIVRIPRNMFNIRLERDPARWSFGYEYEDFRSRFGILVKYPEELQLTEITCGVNATRILMKYHEVGKKQTN